MRAELTLIALAHESNRYLLARLIAKATRKLHRPNTRLQDTMNDALERFSCSKPREAHRAAERPTVRKAVSHCTPRSRLDFSPPHYQARSDNHGNFIRICITYPIT